MTITIGLIAFITSMISAFIGLAGGMTLLGLLTFFVPITTAIALHGVIQAFSNISQFFWLRKDVAWKMAAPLILGLPLGTLISFQVLKTTQMTNFSIILVSLLIFYSVLSPKRLSPLKISYPLYFFVGVGIGFFSLFAGALGPFLAPFLLRDDFSKEKIIATKAITLLFAHLLKIPAFMALGFPFQDYSSVLVTAILATFLGSYFGVKILGKMNENLFRALFKIVLIIAAIKLLASLSF